MDVLGKPQDNRGDVKAAEHLPIHRAAAGIRRAGGGQDLLVTGIKVIDLLVPFAKGGKSACSRAGVARPSTCSS